ASSEKNRRVRTASNSPSRVGALPPPRMAQKKGGPEQRFQPRDGVAGGRLRHADLVGSAADTAAIGRKQKAAQLT
ncbi:MAG: hypothetical protein RJB62_436, partial [Pseudomonadota bacterium]